MVESNQPGGFWPTMYNPFGGLGSKLSQWLSPASDATSNDDAYRITVELPGVPEDAVELEVHEGVLTVSGEKTTEREDKGDTWFFSERQYGAFRRSFRLPSDADDAHVEAHMADGVLEITVPRHKAQTAAGRKVPVKKR